METPELKAEQPASAATNVYTYGMILLWLYNGNTDIALKLMEQNNGTLDVKRIDVDAEAKGLLSSLLCYGDCIRVKQGNAHENEKNSLLKIYQPTLLKQSCICGRFSFYVFLAITIIYH